MKFISFSLALAALLTMASCHCNHGEPNNPDNRYCVKVHLDIDKWLYLTENDDEDARSDDDLQLRYTVWAVLPGEKTPVATVSSETPEVDLYLPEGRCRIMAFADLVKSDAPTRDLYFFTDDHNELLMVHKYDYKGNDENRQGYWAAEDIDVTPAHNCSHYMTCTPLMAKIKLRANDEAKYDVGHVRISYPEGVPAAVDGYNGAINYVWQDVSYECQTKGKIIATDYIYAPVDRDSITLSVDIYNTDGKLSARKKRLRVPYIRRGITTVTGPFFTTLEIDTVPTAPSSGGLGIDPSFSSTVEIPV